MLNINSFGGCRKQMCLEYWTRSKKTVLKTNSFGKCGKKVCFEHWTRSQEIENVVWTSILSENVERRCALKIEPVRKKRKRALKINTYGKCRKKMCFEHWTRSKEIENVVWKSIPSEHLERRCALNIVPVRLWKNAFRLIPMEHVERQCMLRSNLLEDIGNIIIWK